MLLPAGSYFHRAMIGENVKVLSVNCQGLQDLKKRFDVLNYLSTMDANIICLQDTHWTANDEKILKQMWKGNAILNGFSTNSRGVAILLNTNFEYKIISEYKDEDGRLIALDINLTEFSIRLITVYSPNKDTPNFFNNLNGLLDENTQDYLFICGDLNLVLNPSCDSYNYKNLNNPRSRNLLLSMINTFNLIDAFRHLQPSVKRYTWRRKSPTKQARLDYFLISEEMTDLIASCKINPSYRSDHSIIEINISLNNFVRGKGVWKFNCRLLQDEQYLQLINSIIKEEKLKYSALVYSPKFLSIISDEEIHFTINDGQFLEMLMMRIRGETIKYASLKKKKELEREQNLMTDIEYIEKNNLFQGLSDILDDKKAELERLRSERMQGAMARARAQWLKDGEKPTKYFCALERHNYITKTIKCITQNDGVRIVDQKEILKKVHDFYSKLFSSKDLHHCEKSLDNFNFENVRKLTDEESNSLEGELKIKEIGDALKQMKSNKCPGIDGLPAEF